MEKSDKLPKTEGCFAKGEPVDLQYYRTERWRRSVLRNNREPQAGPATGLSNSASKLLTANGDGVLLSASNTETAASSQAEEGLPGSKSVASGEGNTRNGGGPASPCRTNYEGQAGRKAQRQEALCDRPGVGLTHSIQRQDAGLEAGEGVNRTTQSTQATSPV